ncbi:MAG: type II toxin-antitoxin system HicB family antitoxin [Cytophagales bacterium]|nr:type II toxin-antitoxin system HicB family antitoxin [Cytophagales bacterium]
MKKTYTFTIVIEKDESGRFLAICPSLQGCYSEGETVEQAIELIKDAIKLHIEDRIENGELIYEEVRTEQVSIAV